MSFENIEFLALLVIPFMLIFLKGKNGANLEEYFNKELFKKLVVGGSLLNKKLRYYLLLLSIAFAIIALARPYINKGEIKVSKEYVNLVVAFDISKSMQAQDIYPNRLEFAKQKFYELLESFKNARIGVIGFSSRAFLISPLTSDYSTLKYLVKNMNLDYVSLLGTDILEPLKITQELLKDSKHKALIIFSDGGDQESFAKEIEYAKEHNIKVFVYAVATKKGSVIKSGNQVVKDKNGDIVITKLNSHIEELALQSGGAYMPYSLKKGDIKYLVEDLKSKFKATTKEQRSIKDTKELFYYPLMVAILLLFVGLFSLPRRVK
jgi:Ca-activated chloride channel family protein